MSAPTAAKRVARGAALLDEERPGWAGRIDLCDLDLADRCRCVLGQLGRAESSRGIDPYSRIAVRLGLERVRDQAAHGFDIAGADSTSYEELDELWIAEIQRRTAATS